MLRRISSNSLAVEVGGVRVERRDHAAHRLLHERAVVDLVDVLALDALVDFRERSPLLARHEAAAGSVCAVCRSASAPPVSAAKAPRIIPQVQGEASCASGG